MKTQMFRPLAACACLIFLADPVAAAPGDLDLTFADGKVATDASHYGFRDYGRSVAVANDGKIVVAGYTESTRGGYDFAVVRYQVNGTRDASFGNDGTGIVLTDFGNTDDRAYSVAVQTDGKIVVAGSIGQSFAVARYDTDGMLDGTFGSGGWVTTDVGRALSVIVLNDGRILAAGSNADEFSFPDAAVNFKAVCYSPTGMLDGNFGSGGIVNTDFNNSTDIGESVVVQPDGKIVVAGGALNPSGNAFAVVRYNADGTTDNEFGGHGKLIIQFTSSNSRAHSVAVQSDGRILVAGDYWNGDTNDIAIVRLYPDGSRDQSFGSGGWVTTDINKSNDDDGAYSVKVQPNGKILVGGYMDNSHNKNFVVVRYNSDGTMDGSFGKYSTVLTPLEEEIDYAYWLLHNEHWYQTSLTGAAVTDFYGTNDDDIAFGMALDVNGDIILVGSADDGHQIDFAVARYKGDPIPRLTVEQPENTALSAGATVDFGTALVGGAPTRTFSLRNTGNGELNISSLNIQPPAAGNGGNDFVIRTGGGTVALAAGQTRVLKLAFTPDAEGAFHATLHITSNSADGDTFDIALTGTGTRTLTKTFTNGAEAACVTEGLTATGDNTANVSLGFAPVPGTQLMLVDNSGTPIQGTFTNLPDTGLVALTYGGTTYGFFANYHGGDGNDLVLTCFGTMPDPAPLHALFFTDFANPAGIAMFNDAARVGSVIRLTRAVWNQSGAAWTHRKMKLSNGFITRFVCQFGFDPGAGGADGISFNVQNHGNDPSSSEYGNPGLTVTLNTYWNPSELSGNSVVVRDANGRRSEINLDPLAIDLKNRMPHSIVLSHDGATLNLLIDNIPVLTGLACPLGSLMDADGYGWAGFGARTGGAKTNQDLLSWQMYLSNPGPEPYAVDPLPDSTLMGANMTMEYRYPSISSQGTNPLSFQVTPGVEVPSYVPGPKVSVDVREDTLLIYGFWDYAGFPGVSGFASAAFNGLAFAVLRPGPIIGEATVAPANTLAGLDNSRVTFTGDKLWLNLQGLSYDANTVVAVKVRTLPANYSRVRNPDNGRYYTLVPGAVTWEQARTAAAAYALPGYQSSLATITSAAEQAFVSRQFGVNFGPVWGTGTVWLGGLQPAGSSEAAGNWQWVTGEPFAYSNWGPAAPNHLTNANAIEIRRDGCWNNRESTVTGSGYLVESSPLHLDGSDDAPMDLSTGSNSPGSWSYGSETVLGDAFTPLTTPVSLAGGELRGWGMPGNFPFIVSNTTGNPVADGGTSYPTRALAMHPGPTGEWAVLRWTAPAAGWYSIDASFSDIPNLAVATVDVHLLKNGVPVFDGNLGPQTSATYSVPSFAVAAGEVVDFAVGYGANWNSANDHTALRVTIAALASGIADGSFETPQFTYNDTYHYGPLASSWSFRNNSGLIYSNNDSNVRPAPSGKQFAFLQSAYTTGGFGGFAQRVLLPSNGTYLLSYLDAGQPGAGNLAYEVLLDGLPIATQATTSAQPFTSRVIHFFAAEGIHILTFRVSPSQPLGADMAFFDDVAISDDRFISTGTLGTGRSSHTATLLPNGKVLVVGGFNKVHDALASAELYDPATGTWSAAGTLATRRANHTATLLPNGKVLVAGGIDRESAGQVLASAELFDPAAGTWSPTGALAVAHYVHTATLLPNGKVLVAGGYPVTSSTSAELYDPATGTWSATGALTAARYYHSATLLPNGKVLVAGGYDGGKAVFLASAELYDPATGTWSSTGSLATRRFDHTATLLLGGQVLLIGGYNSSGYVGSTELYDSTTGTWSATDALATARSGHTATLMPTGKVLVMGGYHLADAVLYDPATGHWNAAGSLAAARYFHTATLLPNESVLVAGGLDILTTSELYESWDIPRLQNLSLSDATLSPAFDGSILNYTAVVPFTVSSISITPTSLDPTATIQVNGRALTSGAATEPISLAPGTNVVTTVVTAADGLGTVGYTVVVTRQAAVPFSTSYASWQAANFTPAQLADPLVSGPEADPDHDELKNLIEFAFALNPTSGASMQLPQPQRVGGDFVISFTEPDGVSGVIYGAEWSPDLTPGNWLPVPDTGSGGVHTFRVPSGNHPAMFMRLSVTSP